MVKAPLHLINLLKDDISNTTSIDSLSFRQVFLFRSMHALHLNNAIDEKTNKQKKAKNTTCFFS